MVKEEPKPKISISVSLGNLNWIYENVKTGRFENVSQGIDESIKIARRVMKQTGKPQGETLKNLDFVSIDEAKASSEGTKRK